nr:hypothetical protein [Bradyrhizobium sp. BR2003]
MEVACIEHVRLVCDVYGRCYRTRDRRYVQRYYGGDDGYMVRRSYGYYSGPGYYDRGYGFYSGSIGFSLAPGAGELEEKAALCAALSTSILFLR